MKEMDLRDRIVPISRFNRGEANKILRELEQHKVKFIFKNNVPAGVLLKTEKYYDMLEQLENMALYIEAEQRMKDTKPELRRGFNDVLKNVGLSTEDLADIEVDIS